MLIPSFCVIKLYYLNNYYGMAVKYHHNIIKSKVAVYCCSMVVNYNGFV